MPNKLTLSILASLLSFLSFAQDFGDFPKIKKELLKNDLGILYQGLDKFHTGMYWYTPKDSVDLAFKKVNESLSIDLNILEFHKLIAPLVALSREDHTNIQLPAFITEKLNQEIKFLPFTVVFLGDKLYCVKNGSDLIDTNLEGKQIELINGESPIEIVQNIENLFASDGYIKTVKFNDLKGFNFSTYYYKFYGELDTFEVKFKGIEESFNINSLKTEIISQNLSNKYKNTKKHKAKDLLEYIGAIKQIVQ